MADETREIRARVDLVDLVSQRVSLKKAGRHWKGLCPFHEDKNPSFLVSPEMGRYRCWSCGEQGDAFTWVMKTQNVEFAEALQIIAKLAGVTLKKRGDGHTASQRQTWAAAMAEALQFFREQFAKSDQVQEYCQRRGITQEVLDLWEIGYAPDVGDALASTLKRKGLPLPECRQLFLVDQDSSQGYFDKFRGRLMFPIRDERGELVAFGGRLLGDGHPKYINSGDTPLYRKSRVLYGMDHAKDTLKKTNRAILVEGYLDVIACHSAGLKGALASLGTALADEQARLLKRWCEEVVVLYDSDAAGQKAARRAAEILTPVGLKVRVALMPEGEDPDTLLKSGGPGAIERTVDRAVSPLDFEVLELSKRLKPEQEEYWSELAQLLATARNEMELDRHIVHQASLYPGRGDPVSSQRALRRDVLRWRKLKSKPSGQEAVSFKTSASSAEALRPSEIALIRAFLDSEYRQLAWSAFVEPELMATQAGAQASESVRSAFPKEPPTGPANEWLPLLEPESVRTIFADAAFDLRAPVLSSEGLQDDIAALRLLREKRALAGLKSSGLTAEARAEYFERLRRMKNDDSVNNS